MTVQLCFNCNNVIEPNILHNCIKGITDNINRLHSNINLLLHHRLVERDKSYWEGFDDCIKQVMALLETADPHIWTDLLMTQVIKIAKSSKKNVDNKE